MNTLTMQAGLQPPALTTELKITPDPAGAHLADLQFGTLHPEARTGSYALSETLHFTPAWNVNEEARASEVFLGMPPDQALHEAVMRALRAGRRRVLCGVTWRYERLTVRVKNALGEVLACEAVDGIPSDLDGQARRDLEADLHQEALKQARDWAVLGLN